MEKLIIITGATATGKSDFGVNLAKQIDGEIIGCDSMQIYRKMDIGTAKVSTQEMQGIRHHMIDIVNPNEEFSASQYRQQALVAIEDIKARGKVPIVVGGTGLFISSLIYEFDFCQTPKNQELRDKLSKMLDEGGVDLLHSYLSTLSPEKANEIHKNNTKRVFRAIEILLENPNATKREKKFAFDSKIAVLSCDRDFLYERINTRVDNMIASGLIGEIEKLLSSGLTFDMQSMQAIGYKEFKDYFFGSALLEDCVGMLKQNSRNYAKRQMTWFRHQFQMAEWFDCTSEKQNAVKYLLN